MVLQAAAAFQWEKIACCKLQEAFCGKKLRAAACSGPFVGNDGLLQPAASFFEAVECCCRGAASSFV
jgi:hypothetical protein